MWEVANYRPRFNQPFSFQMPGPSQEYDSCSSPIPLVLTFVFASF